MLVLAWLVWLASSLCALANTLNVLCLNGGWFPGRERDPSEYSQTLHMRQAQQLLIEVNPDIFLMQELRDWSAATQLVSVLPDFTIHAVTHFNQKQELMIASRFPAVATWSEAWIEQPTNTPPRGFAAAVLHLPGDRAFPIYTVHYKSNYQAEAGDDVVNAALREEAARQLVSHTQWMLENWWGYPVDALLVGGDMNTSYPAPIVRGEQTFPIMIQGGLVPMISGGIDHFLGWGDVTNGSVAVLSDYRVSDHQPILLSWDLGRSSTWKRAKPIKMTRAQTRVELLVNLNSASATDLAQLPGIGPVLARRIIDHRPYARVNDLADVPGVGPLRIQKLEALVTTVPSNTENTVSGFPN